MKHAEPDFALGPSLDFLRGLWQLNHALESASKRMEATIGITAQQRLVLRCVGKYPGISAGNLATLLHVDPGTISASIKRLEKKGLVQRRRDPKDKRRVFLGLTEEGHQLDRPERQTIEAVVTTVLSKLGASDTEATQRVLQQLVVEIDREFAPERTDTTSGESEKVLFFRLHPWDACGHPCQPFEVRNTGLTQIRSFFRVGVEIKQHRQRLSPTHPF